MSDFDNYKKFVLDEQKSSAFKNWKRDNPGEFVKWLDANSTIMNQKTPTLPVLVTAYGKGLVDAMEIYLFDIPDPITASGGLGLYQLGGSLENCSHLNDDTYSVIVGDWADAKLLSSLPSETYSYTVSNSGVDPSTASEYVILDPNGKSGLSGSLVTADYISKCISLKNQYSGLKGIFLDNCNQDIDGLLNALSIIYPALHAAGLKFAANVGSYASGNSGSDNGSLWQEWAKQVSPYLDRLMLENWMTPSNQQPPIKVRTSGSSWDQNYDGWIKCPSICPGKFFGVTYGPEQFGVYARAAMLLAPNANSNNVFFNNDNPVASDPIGRAWTKKSPIPSINPLAGTAIL